MFNSHTQLEEEIEVLEKTEKSFNLILYNDDVNTFEHVTETLIKVCGHDPLQAEQCTWLVHFKGKCSVKEGDFHKLEPLCTAILNRGIQARIE